MTGAGWHPPPDLFGAVRTAAAGVAARARFVRIQQAATPGYAASLAADLVALPSPTWDEAHHFRGEPAETAAFVLCLDSVNFGSGWFPVLTKRPGLSGYYTVATALTDRFRRRGPFSAAELEALTAADCAGLFGQDPTGPAADLLAGFGRALNDLGAWLRQGWHGDPLGPFTEAAGSAERLVRLLLRMPLFRDVADHDGQPVPLLKRAQLLVADAALALAGTDVGRFADLDRLTLFADNLVPHVLRLDGMVAYDPDLLSRIDRGDPIAAGSPEEVEIRAVAVHAVELIVADLCRRGLPATAARLDHLLWHRGQLPAYKRSPRHRTRSVFY